MDQPRQIFKNTIVLGIADLVNRVGGLVLSFFIGRMLGAEGLGIYSTAIAYYALLVVAGGMGAENFLIREIAKDRAKTSHYVVHTSIMGIVASIITMTLFFVALPYLGYSHDLTMGMYLIIFATIPGILSSIQNAVFVAHQRVEFVMYTRFVATLISVSLDYCLLMQGYNIVYLLAVFVATEYLTTLFFYIFISRFITTLHWNVSLSAIRQLIPEIKTFAALSLLAGLLARPEIIILSIVQDETEAGFYSAAIKLVLFWQFISQIFMTNVYPVLSQAYHVGDQQFQFIQDKALKYLLALSLPLMAGLIAAADPIIRLMYGSGFGTAVPVLRILALGIPSIFVNAVLWRVLVARDHQDQVFQIRVISLLVRIIGGCLLIIWIGAYGAAVIAVVSWGLDIILFVYWLGKEDIKINLLHTSWRFALAAAGMGILAWAMTYQFQLWALVPLACIVYAVLVFVLRAFSPDDFALFRQIWQPER